MGKPISPKSAAHATQIPPYKVSRTSLGSGKVLVKKVVEKLVKIQVVVSGFRAALLSLVRRTLESYRGLPKRLVGPMPLRGNLQLIIRLESYSFRERLAPWVAHGPRQGGSRRFRLFKFHLTG